MDLVYHTFMIEHIERTKNCDMKFFVRLPVPELWLHNPFWSAKRPRNTIMKHFNTIVSIISFVENIERTISCTMKISVSLPVPELPATQRLVHRPRPGGPTGPVRHWLNWERRAVSCASRPRCSEPPSHANVGTRNQSNRRRGEAARLHAKFDLDCFNWRHIGQFLASLYPPLRNSAYFCWNFRDFALIWSYFQRNRRLKPSFQLVDSYFGC